MISTPKKVGLLWWLRRYRACLQCRRPRFDPWVRKILWGREWLPAPVFLPGEFHGPRSLVGYSLWGCKESDTTERLTHTAQAASPKKLDIEGWPVWGRLLDSTWSHHRRKQSCVGPEPVQSTSGLLFSLGTQMPAFLFF